MFDYYKQTLKYSYPILSYSCKLFITQDIGGGCNFLEFFC